MKRAGTLSKDLHRGIFRRMPECMDGFHRRKLEHNHRPPIRLALEDFDFPTPDQKLPAELHDKWDDGFAIFPILRFVVDRTRNHESDAETDAANNGSRRCYWMRSHRDGSKPSAAAYDPATFDLVLNGALADDGANISGESAMAPVLRVFLAAVLLLSGVAPSLAQGYPNRPVRVVVGFPPGGPTDVIARIVAQRLSESLGQQFFVENIGGAGGNTAAGQVARVTPDGYTIMAISTGFMVNPSLYAKVPYDPVKDFSAVSLVAVSPNVVVVNPSVPATTLPELIQLIRDNPGKYSFAGPGVGSTPHLGGELFRLAFKLDLVHVPFTGAAPAVQAIIGGHIPIAFTALPSSLSAIQAGQVRALGVAATERAGGIPGVPTFAEQGVKDEEADTLTGIVAPAGTPKEIVDLLSREIAQSVARPDVNERLAVLGFKGVGNTSEEFGARIKLEIEKWGKVVRDANLRIE
jgi:tripartite-type tricarboxylate transporter receptor subunit TctC